MSTQLTILAGACLAIAPGPPEGAHETGGAQYVSPGRVVLALPASPAAGGFASVQVNTIGGMNVVGDAANEPSIAVDPTAPNRMAVGWRQFDTIESNFRQAGYSWTVDGGRTWAGTHVIEPCVFRSDPVLRSSRDGVFYYLSLASLPVYETDLFVSEDAGQSWLFGSDAYGGDKAWMCVDNSNGIGGGNIYQAWLSQGKTFNRSIDMGAEWEEPTEFIPGSGIDPSFGTIDVGPDGELIVVGFEGSPSSLGVVRSFDAQDPKIVQPTFEFFTFEAPRGFEFDAMVPCNPGGYTQAWSVIDSSDGTYRGRAYALATARRIGTKEYHIAIALSDDSGATWSEPVFVNDDTGHEKIVRWFGTIAVAPNGRVDVVFNDSRNAPNDEPNLTRTYYTFSTDGGATWSDDQAIGPQWDSFVGWPNQNKIGDYYDMHSDLLGANLIYAATYNGEQDVYFARIGPYDCNANGVDDEVDIAGGASGDCNRNDIPDECEIAAGTLHDANRDGVPDECACPADVNGDGALNVLDFVAFQLLWQAEDPGADCDRNGTFDVIDFICFQSLFVAGCD
jgi:hypothetical protein